MKILLKFITGILVIFFVLAIAFLLLLYIEPYTPDGSPQKLKPPDSFPPSSVDRMLDDMEFGTVAFNAPTSINIDESPQIQLLLSLAESVEKLKQSITEEGEKVGVNIKVSERMKHAFQVICFKLQQ